MCCIDFRVGVPCDEEEYDYEYPYIVTCLGLTLCFNGRMMVQYCGDNNSLRRYSEGD